MRSPYSILLSAAPRHYHCHCHRHRHRHRHRRRHHCDTLSKGFVSVCERRNVEPRSDVDSYERDRRYMALLAEYRLERSMASRTVDFSHCHHDDCVNDEESCKLSNHSFPCTFASCLFLGKY